MTSFCQNMFYKLKSFVVFLKVFRKLSEMAFERPYISKLSDGSMPPEPPTPKFGALSALDTSCAYTFKISCYAPVPIHVN